MKIKCLTAVLLFSLPGLTFAEDCQITLSQAVVDYHQMRRENIVTVQRGGNRMAERDIDVSAYCPEKQQMAVLLQGVANEKGYFKLGEYGGVAVKVSEMVVDGKPYGVGKTGASVMSPGEGDASVYLKNNEAVVAVGNGQVPAGQQMSFRVTVFPVLKDGAFGRISDQTSLQSELTWQVSRY